ncbi:hypothetical protein CONLIGDRAFT_330550 [Coniochaeta ligniaria NRRL 30616]|uniref:Uncharacterized protein n=1 Tax=Coniochaeta ligniaria NRRL 30616 TaxID=1408157 RepID=A0A1J7IQK4_9PEZI|nr:hypothetical protein CONLIGDRAFT_330550 [Coniochaeta ligniaria NRRL 30616]
MRTCLFQLSPPPPSLMIASLMQCEEDVQIRKSFCCRTSASACSGPSPINRLQPCILRNRCVGSAHFFSLIGFRLGAGGKVFRQLAADAPDTAVEPHPLILIPGRRGGSGRSGGSCCSGDSDRSRAAEIPKFCGCAPTVLLQSYIDIGDSSHMRRSCSAYPSGGGP